MKRAILGLIWAVLTIQGAHAETVTLSYQAVMHVHASHGAPVLDQPNHIVGIAAFRGIAIFSEDDIAVHRYDGWFDLENGSGKFHGYALWRFEDGSEIKAAYDGDARRASNGNFEVEAGLHSVSGTGRFAKATGDGTFSGRRLEPIDKGGSTYLTGTLTLDLPN
ncbi:MAG: hypothetical protein MI806_34010 [Minwuiales bacterium]|nr:hypothetical protein [Minwuiales bacterium]